MVGTALWEELEFSVSEQQELTRHTWRRLGGGLREQLSQDRQHRGNRAGVCGSRQIAAARASGTGCMQIGFLCAIEDRVGACLLQTGEGTGAGRAGRGTGGRAGGGGSEAGVGGLGGWEDWRRGRCGDDWPDERGQKRQRDLCSAVLGARRGRRAGHVPRHPRRARYLMLWTRRCVVCRSFRLFLPASPSPSHRQAPRVLPRRAPQASLVFPSAARLAPRSPPLSLPLSILLFLYNGRGAQIHFFHRPGPPPERSAPFLPPSLRTPSNPRARALQERHVCAAANARW